MMFCKPWSSRGHGREMGRGGKVTPQVTLSFAPGRPPILDPNPAKPPNIISSWPGQMWSHLSNIFTSPPPVQWINPQLVRECPPPSLLPYNGYCSYPAVPCTTTTMDPGGGLWHRAPPGNLQQQQMMDPLQMLQGNAFIPGGKVDTHTAFPGGNKVDTHNAFPGGNKMDTHTAFPGDNKIDTHTAFPGGNKVDTHNAFPVDGGFLIGEPVSPVYPSKVPTKRLNPNAKEWVPREYRTSLPSAVSTTSTGHAAGQEMLRQNHLSPAPGISYTPQDFCEITEEEVKEVRGNGCPPLPPPAVLLSPGTSSLGHCQNMVPQFSANDIPGLESETVMCLTSIHPEGSTKEGSPVQSSHSVSPCCWENSANQAVMCEERESERESGGQSRESRVFIEETVLESSGQCGEPWSLLPSTESNSAGQEAFCPSPENSESPKTATKEKSASPDQVECSTTSRPESPAVLGPTQTTDSSPESYRLNPEFLSSSPTCPRKITSPEKGLVVRLEVPPAQSVVVSAIEDASCSNQKCPSSAEAPASILSPEGHQSVPDTTTTINSAALSYAGVLVRSSPSPPPPPSPPEQLKYKGVEQPLPKIFQREEMPPREPAVSRVETERKMPELFRRPTKTQRTQSKKFLEELKESSLPGDGNDIVGCGSSPSSSSSSSSSDSDLSQSPDVSPIPSSPFHANPPMPMSPSRCSPLVARSSPQVSPISIAIPIPIPTCGAYPSQLESPDSRAQSSSVSSTASLDIEFVEEDEVDLGRSSGPPCSPRKPSDRLGARNGFLACILGSGDSDSEEEDDWDADWDEGCVGESGSTPGLDDSWETFGLGLVVVDCRVESSEKQRVQCRVKEPKTEECVGSPHLAEINKRWEAEVRRNVKGKSAQLVRFSGEKVHPMVVWGHAYREARRGPWEQEARDRARFAQRIDTLKPVLSPVLEASHRRAVYHRLHSPTPRTRCFL